MKTERINVSRRDFLIQSTALGAGFSLGLYLPVASRAAFAAEGAAAQSLPTPEVNAWVVIQADDTVIIRIARSEMGQGTLTGLAQMVAEELECDWSLPNIPHPVKILHAIKYGAASPRVVARAFAVVTTMCVRAVRLRDIC